MSETEIEYNNARMFYTSRENILDMPKNLVLAYDGISEIQLKYTYYRLREDALPVFVVDCTMGDGIEIDWEVDSLLLPEMSPECCELVVIPGTDNESVPELPANVLDWLREYHSERGTIGAIGTGISPLIGIDALENRLIASPDTVRSDVDAAGGNWTGDAVTIDGNIVTARDESALPFFVHAVLHNVIIPQPDATIARERPSW